MDTEKKTETELTGLINDLQVFIELSFQKDEASLAEWIAETVNRVETRCWEKNRCDEKKCPAYQNECGRCWLLAGTMCHGRTQGRLAEKYGSCAKCDIFRNVVGNDPARRLRELVIVLIHSLRLQQQELKESLAEIKRLSGLLPICASCKKIRDDKGYWNQIEAYIREHSEVEFSHSICPECLKKLYPDFSWPRE